MRPTLGKFQAGARNKIRDNARNKNFAGLSLCHHSGCRVNRNAADVAASDLNLTGMDACAKRQADLI